MPSFSADKPPLDLGDDRDPWERQTGETDKRFSQFVVFRDQGPTRTLANTAKTLALSASYIRHTACHYRWQERVESWDREHDRIFLARMASERQKVAQLHLGMGTAMFTKIRQRLDTITPATLSVVELVRMTEVALKLQQSGLGLPDTTVAIVGDPTQPVAHQDVTGMSLADRQALLDRTITELQRRRAHTAPEPGAQPDE